MGELRLRAEVRMTRNAYCVPVFYAFQGAGALVALVPGGQFFGGSMMQFGTGLTLVGVGAGTISVVMYGSATGKWDKAAIMGVQMALDVAGPLKGLAGDAAGYASDEMVNATERQHGDCDGVK